MLIGLEATKRYTFTVKRYTFTVAVDNPPMKTPTDLEAERLRRSFAQSNEVVNAIYSMPVTCHRVLLLALSKITWKAKEATNYTVVITAKEYAKIYMPRVALRDSNAYTEMQQAAIDLQTTESAVLRVPIKHGFQMMAWFDVATYLPQSGCIVATFGTSIRTHISNLWADFTVGDLHAVSGFRSKHSFRLYHLLCQYSDTGYRTETVSELRAKMGIKLEQYKRYRNLRARVIEPAIKEIEATGVKVSVIEKRKGRAVDRLEFRFNMAR